MSEILAKKPRGSRRITLFAHTMHVMDAAEELFGTTGCPTRLALEWLRFFRVDPTVFDSFLHTLQVAAACHDLGKANSSFAGALSGTCEQIIRHEHLSALLIAHEWFGPWMTVPDVDADVVLSAVLTHHLKVTSIESKPYYFASQLAPPNVIRVLFDDPDFKLLLDAIADRLALSKLSLCPVPTLWAYLDRNGKLPVGTLDLDGHRKLVMDNRMRKFEIALRKSDPRRRLLWAVRSALITADAVGSGLPRTEEMSAFTGDPDAVIDPECSWRIQSGRRIKDWIARAFDGVLTESDIRAQVVQPRLDELTSKGRFEKWSEFQDACATLPERALLLAPCGSGKTLAAWRWIEAQLKARPAARVIFLYPTRATAKEGFRDYVSWAPEAALMHGKASFDLQDIFANPDDPRHESSYEVDRRLFSLAFWNKRIFSATIDQFLAFTQYGYGPMCMLPVLCDSVLVIDEVHSFDRAMFAALKEFLKQFDLPVLCMTATLTSNRRCELQEECGLQVYQDKPGELGDVAKLPRYRLTLADDREIETRVREALQEGKRVLWVVNRVRKAQELAVRLACDFRPQRQQSQLNFNETTPLYCYHSRFRLIDRVQRHESVVQNFRADSPPALAITTQVCEMSLDMDADMLVTEFCPVSSLIQRMGRCNRDRNARPLSKSGEVVIYDPGKREPYDDASLTGLREFIGLLKERSILNQIDLEEALESVPQPPVLNDPLCSFSSSSPYAWSGQEDFREIEEFSQPAVLVNEVDDWLSAGERRPGFELPVPKHLLRSIAPDPRLSRHLGVAPDGHYHDAIGFCDTLLTDMLGAK